ncbi:MAG: TetR/AcrR family transcriptional regulator [Flavobacteriales bacterium]|nr:TetR/AcrR family transcriptional regulator [Flavobacteriales bacterium]
MEQVIIKQDKKTLILNTTLRLLSKNGFHGTPISMIAENASIGAGTIYRYFKNKEELINELFIEIKKRIINAMYEGYDETADYETRFRVLWVNMINYYNDNPTEFVFIEQHRYAPYVSTLTRAESNRILSPVLLFFLEGKKNKYIKHLPLYTIIGLIYGPIITMVKLHLDHNKNLTSIQINKAAEACWDAVKCNNK